MNKQPIKATVMGCGSSLGVPAAGNFWGDCDPTNPKNRRTRSSLLHQSENTNILVDTTVDVRDHLNEYNISKLDGVIYTHAHSDHVNGIDDLRVISYAMQRPIKAYSNLETHNELDRRFNYVFNGSGDIYRPFIDLDSIAYGPHRIGDIRMELFRQDHGTCDTIGIRVNDFAYSVDMVDLDDQALEKLQGIKTWVVDAAGFNRPDDDIYTHANLARVQKWAEILDVQNVYLIVLTGMMDYDKLCRDLPSHIRPAYDGISFNI